MPHFAANLTMMFNEVPFPQRFAAAAKGGFKAVEFLFPYEPDEGEIDYRHILRLLDELGYSGWVGCEYRPRGRTEDGLGWLREVQ